MPFRLTDLREHPPLYDLLEVVILLESLVLTDRSFGFREAHLSYGSRNMRSMMQASSEP